MPPPMSPPSRRDAIPGPRAGRRGAHSRRASPGQTTPPAGLTASQPQRSPRPRKHGRAVREPRSPTVRYQTPPKRYAKSRSRGPAVAPTPGRCERRCAAPPRRRRRSRAPGAGGAAYRGPHLPRARPPRHDAARLRAHPRRATRRQRRSYASPSRPASDPTPPIPARARSSLCGRDRRIIVGDLVIREPAAVEKPARPSRTTMTAANSPSRGRLPSTPPAGWFGTSTAARIRQRRGTITLEATSSPFPRRHIHRHRVGGRGEASPPSGCIAHEERRRTGRSMAGRLRCRPTHREALARAEPRRRDRRQRQAAARRRRLRQLEQGIRGGRLTRTGPCAAPPARRSRDNRGA